MTVNSELRRGSTASTDGTTIGYYSLGAGPGLIIVGGVLTSGADYFPLARALAADFEVHVMDRRGRAGSGPQRPDHSIDDECADLVAVAGATGATAVFGHSFGGLIALETARQHPIFDELFAFEPGVPLRGQLALGWLDGYQQLLDTGDRRGAFAFMVKHAGFAPRPLGVMPLWYVRAVLHLAIRRRRWGSMEPLLEANLTEHRILADLDGPTTQRFSTVAARSLLIGGDKGPRVFRQDVLPELAAVMPNADVVILPGLSHAAPQEHPDPIAVAIRNHVNRSQPAISNPAGRRGHEE